MKKTLNYITILFILLSVHAFGQTAVIPDPQFRNFLQTNYPQVFDVNNELIISEAAKVTGQLRCPGLGITDLTGAQYFTSINSLDFSNNAVSVLPDLSPLKTSLISIRAQNNALTSFPGLDQLTRLTHLSCQANNLESLPDLSNLKTLGTFICANNKISDLTFVQNLIKVKILEVQGNELSQLPSLDKLTVLTVLRCSRNNLTALPSLLQNINLTHLDISNNPLTSFPQISHLSQLQELLIANIGLTEMPNLDGLSSLTKVDVTGNSLTFEDLLPYSFWTSFSTIFHVQPQDTSGTYVETGIQNRSYVVVTPAFSEEHIEGNNYAWYNNGTLVETTTTPELTINSPTISDTGHYYSIITNNAPEFAGIQLVSKSALLTGTQCTETADITVTTTDKDCEKDGDIILSSNVANITYYLTTPGGAIIENNTGEFSGMTNGTYSLNYEVEGCIQNYASSITIFTSFENCNDMVISPNGDNKNDSYFISEQGEAKIFDRNGKLIKTISTPAYWNGSNDSGEILTTGLYLIFVNEDKIYEVTLVR